MGGEGVRIEKWEVVGNDVLFMTSFWVIVGHTDYFGLKSKKNLNDRSDWVG